MQSAQNGVDTSLVSALSAQSTYCGLDPLPVIGDDPDYEVLTVRGTIQVDPEADVSVPRFGGQPSDELTFDLGEGRVGTCSLTGALPGVG